MEELRSSPLGFVLATHPGALGGEIGNELFLLLSARSYTKETNLGTILMLVNRPKDTILDEVSQPQQTWLCCFRGRQETSRLLKSTETGLKWGHQGLWGRQESFNEGRGLQDEECFRDGAGQH